MCALEAMALGTPVVSTPTDGMKDLIRPGENGYLSASDEALAQAIEKILKNPHHRQTLATQAKQDFAAFNDEANYKSTLAACYGGCL